MNKALMVGVLALVMAALIWGFNVVGGPGYARMEQADWRRISKLESAHRYLQCRQSSQILPETSDAAGYCKLSSSSHPFSEPEVEMPIKYRRLDDTHFEICAEFELAPDVVQARSKRYALVFDGQTGCMKGTTLPDK